MKKLIALLLLAGAAHAHDPCDPQVFNPTSRTCEDPAPPPPPPPTGELLTWAPATCSNMVDPFRWADANTELNILIDSPNATGTFGGCTYQQFGRKYPSGAWRMNKCQRGYEERIEGQSPDGIVLFLCASDVQPFDPQDALNTVEFLRSQPNTAGLPIRAITMNVDNPPCSRLLVDVEGSIAAAEFLFSLGLIQRYHAIVGDELLSRERNELRGGSDEYCHPNSVGSERMGELTRAVLAAP